MNYDKFEKVDEQKDSNDITVSKLLLSGKFGRKISVVGNW
jgi:hypothetical protein